MADPPLDNPSPSVGYANRQTPRSTFRSRAVALWMAFIVLLVGLASAPILLNPQGAQRWWQEHQAQLAQARQRQAELPRRQACLTYTAPPDAVAYEEETARAQKLLDADPRYMRLGQCEVPGRIMPVAYQPKALTDLIGFPRSCVFLHGLGPSGQDPHLIMVTLQLEPMGAGRLVTLTAHEILPGLRQVHSPGEVWEHLSRDDRFRIHAGRVDPADPSHFTIEYVKNEKTRIIDGHWAANRVIMNLRANP